jgi:hypothetical protein
MLRVLSLSASLDRATPKRGAHQRLRLVTVITQPRAAVSTEGVSHNSYLFLAMNLECGVVRTTYYFTSWLSCVERTLLNSFLPEESVLSTAIDRTTGRP